MAPTTHFLQISSANEPSHACKCSVCTYRRNGYVAVPYSIVEENLEANQTSEAWRGLPPRCLHVLLPTVHVQNTYVNRYSLTGAAWPILVNIYKCKRLLYYFMGKIGSHKYLQNILLLQYNITKYD